MKDTDDTGNSVLADAWGTPLRFYRFATQDYTTKDSDLQQIAPTQPLDSRGQVIGGIDSLDPGYKLLNWSGTNASQFDNGIPARGFTQGNKAQFAIPVIVSAGPDRTFGLPAVDSKTQAGTNSDGITTINGVAPFQNMTPGDTTAESDNIYSFSKKVSD